MALVRDGITPEMRELDGYEQDTCPRCQRYEIGFAALSRADNKTHVCARCGEAEAMEQFLTGNLGTGWLRDGKPWAELVEVDRFINQSEVARSILIERMQSKG